MRPGWRLAVPVGVLFFCAVHISAALPAEVQELAKPFVEKLLRGTEKDAAPLVEPGRPPLGVEQLRRALMDNRQYLFSLVKAFAPGDWAPYLDSISGALDYAETLAKQGKALDRLYGVGPESPVDTLLSSPDFRRLAGQFYWRNCRTYDVTFPPDPLPKAVLAEIRLLESDASNQEKTCRTIAIVALTSQPLLIELSKYAR